MANWDKRIHSLSQMLQHLTSFSFFFFETVSRGSGITALKLNNNQTNLQPLINGTISGMDRFKMTQGTGAAQEAFVTVYGNRKWHVYSMIETC